MKRYLGVVLLGSVMGTVACAQDVDIGTLRPGNWGVEGSDRNPGVNQTTSSSSSGGVGMSSSSSGGGGGCTEDACGGRPPVMRPEPCADGTEREYTFSCEKTSGGTCGWNIDVTECPAVACNSDADCASGQACVNGECTLVGFHCEVEQCGPVPPVAPPMMCEDGTVESVSVVCEPGPTDACGWQVYRSGCPHVQPCQEDSNCPQGQACINGVCSEGRECSPMQCGEPPPVAPPQVCEDGSLETVTVTCGADAMGTCGWQVTRSGCPEVQQCLENADCPMGQLCVNGVCRLPGFNCLPMDCTEPAPVAEPLQCEPGTSDTVTVVCEPGPNDACGWVIHHSGCQGGGGECSTDGDCAMGERCFEGRCLAPGWVCEEAMCGERPDATPRMCGNGTVEMVHVVCEPGPNDACGWQVYRSGCESPIQCMADSDCTPGLLCLNGVCSREGLMCASDGDCPAGHVCQGGICGLAPSSCEPEQCGVRPPVAPPMMCLDGSLELVDVACQPDASGACTWQVRRSGCPEDSTCTSDADCAAGQVCLNGMCGAGGGSLMCFENVDCPAGQVCVNGLCGGGGGSLMCNADTDCPAGQACVNGLCGGGGGSLMCGSNGDCPAGQVCVNGMCGAGGGGSLMCNADTDCPAGQACVNGLCGGGSGGGGGGSLMCSASADCPPGQACVEGLCR